MIFREFSNKNQLIWILNAKVMSKTILLSPKNHPLAAVEISESLEFVCCAVFVVFVVLIVSFRSFVRCRRVG